MATMYEEKCGLCGRSWGYEKTEPGDEARARRLFRQHLRRKHGLPDNPPLTARQKRAIAGFPKPA